MKIVFALAMLLCSFSVLAQEKYDSVTISKFIIDEKDHDANWDDSLRLEHFSHHVNSEQTIWRMIPLTPLEAKNESNVLFLTRQIKANGTGDVAKCFIPRHSINYYRSGRIVRFMLVCFECDGILLSGEKANFVKSEKTRAKQMARLKTVFKALL